MLTTVTFYIFLIIPGHPAPVSHSKADVSIEECLDDVKFLLEKVNPEWPPGTVMQAGCSVKLPGRDEADKTDGNH